jgi:proteasome lid subunit RPN8/RPN11
MAQIISMNTLVTISAELVNKTLARLQLVGRRRSEHVLLWLGKRENGVISINKLWIPEQRAGRDFFEIPERSMQALFDELRRNRLIVAAQVHTHPRKAFHSWADDAWAIVRHAGALSLVLPYFGLKTQPHSFANDAAVFVLSPKNEWLEVPAADRQQFYQIIQ